MNPYASPPVTTAQPQQAVQSPHSKFTRWLLLYFSPVLGIATIYAAWLLAWLTLGHPPRPMIDDPKSIGGAMTVVYWTTLLTSTCAMCLAPVCCVVSFFCPKVLIRNNLVQGIVLTVMYVAICTGMALFLRLDPGRVLEWWGD